MATNREEIIEDFQEHIRKTGGASSDWLIGTAKDPRSTFFMNHIVADLGDGLIYREAFTTNSADAIRDHFVNDCDLRLDLEDAPEPGKIVFIYRKAVGCPKSEFRSQLTRPTPPPSDQSVFPKRAA